MSVAESTMYKNNYAYNPTTKSVGGRMLKISPLCLQKFVQGHLRSENAVEVCVALWVIRDDFPGKIVWKEHIIYVSFAVETRLSISRNRLENMQYWRWVIRSVSLTGMRVVTCRQTFSWLHVRKLCAACTAHAVRSSIFWKFLKNYD